MAEYYAYCAIRKGGSDPKGKNCMTLAVVSQLVGEKGRWAGGWLLGKTWALGLKFDAARINIVSRRDEKKFT